MEIVTLEHGLVFAEEVYRQTIDTEVFSEAFGRTHVMTFRAMVWMEKRPPRRHTSITCRTKSATGFTTKRKN